MTDGMSQRHPGIAILRVSGDGEVVAASRGARLLLGGRVRGPCAQQVRARDADGARVCVDGCASSLARSEPPALRERLGVLVRGQPARVRCERVGDEVIVVLRWWNTAAPVEPLTPREREVMRRVAAGMTDRLVAERLGLRVSTVRTHVEHARAKLGARTRAHAVARAIATGQLASDEGAD